MVKLSRPLSPEQNKNLQIRQTRREILDKVWTMIVILGLLTLAVYGVVIQILHHP